ncbi:MAG TPA: alpha/beta hydrolase [Candidatus Hydrogenedentes bacterium]|nr:alpha/beta hydrolase [Candidatus Hydrogenedentota bacterium]
MVGKMKKRTRRIVVAIAVGFLFSWGVVAAGGVYFTVRPRPAAIEDIEMLGNDAVESVFIDVGDGVRLSAWHIPSNPTRAVIFLAGIDSNRRAGLERAVFFLEHGYSMLLPDLRATGKSTGPAVTIGWEERKDLKACYEFLRDRGYTEIGANGISLGAATICYALPHLPELSFVILESSYDTLGNAVRNRLGLVGVPHFIAWPYYIGLSFFTHTPSWRLRPVEFMEHCAMPALILAGDSEPELKVSETQALYNRCSAPMKRLHLFREGRHQDFLRKYPEEYKEVAATFLAEVREARQP